MAAQVAHERVAVRRVDDRDALDDVRMMLGQVPGDRAAPVVSDHLRALAPERPDDGDDVGRETIDAVRGDARGLAAEADAALVGRHHAESGRGQRRDVAVPAMRGLGKAMQQEQQRAVGRPRGERVELQAVGGDGERFQVGRHRPIVDVPRSARTASS